MTSSWTRWLSIRVQDWVRGSHSESAPELKLRFRLPPGFTSVDGVVPRTVVVCRETDAQPLGPDTLRRESAALLTVVPAYQHGGSLEASLQRQREHRSPTGRRLEVAELVPGIEPPLGRTVIRPQGNGPREVSLCRLHDGYLWICGYMAEGSPEDAPFHEVATQLLTSLEHDGPEAPTLPAPGEPFEDRERGVAYPIIEGWESSEMMGDFLQFAPGDGFRTRISVASESAEEIGHPPEFLAEVHELYDSMSQEIEEPEHGTRVHALGEAATVRFHAALRANALRPARAIEAFFMVLPANAGRFTVVGYLGAYGEDFEQYRPTFERFLEELRLLPDEPGDS